MENKTPFYVSMSSINSPTTWIYYKGKMEANYCYCCLANCCFLSLMDCISSVMPLYHPALEPGNQEVRLQQTVNQNKS